MDDTSTPATPEQILERVWRAINAMPDEVAKLPPSNNDAYQYFVRRAQSPLCEAFVLDQGLVSHIAEQVEPTPEIGSLGLTPEQICAALECWRSKMIQAVDAERYMAAAKNSSR